MAGEPPLPLAALLRRELDAHVAGLGRRRVTPAVVHVGVPGVERVPVAPAPLGEREVGWRADLLDRAIEGAEQPSYAWITRAGTLEPTSDDHAWCGAAAIAFARHGLPLHGFHVLNRYGWRNLRTGEVVEFYRIRRR